MLRFQLWGLKWNWSRDEYPVRRKAGHPSNKGHLGQIMALNWGPGDAQSATIFSKSWLNISWKINASFQLFMLHLSNVAPKTLTSGNLKHIFRISFLCGIMFLLSLFMSRSWYKICHCLYRLLRNKHPNGNKYDSVNMSHWAQLERNKIKKIHNGDPECEKMNPSLNKNNEWKAKQKKYTGLLMSPFRQFLTNEVICAVQYDSYSTTIKWPQWLQMVWRLFGTRISAFLCMSFYYDNVQLCSEEMAAGQTTRSYLHSRWQSGHDDVELLTRGTQVGWAYFGYVVRIIWRNVQTIQSCEFVIGFAGLYCV